MLHGTVSLSHGVGLDNGRANNSSQLYLMERVLENQIKESMNESETLSENFQNDLISMREDVERRASERHRHAKRQQAKLEEEISCAEREKADLLQHNLLLQEEVVVATGEIRLARDRVFKLEAEVQSLRTRGPLVVERSDPASVAETSRLRDRGAAVEEQARRAQREASEARQQVGRELAVNQSLQRDVDNARHRLLTVQGSLAQSVEENIGLRRELEAERVKAAGGSRRLRDAVELHSAALEEIRKESARLREQRDSFGYDCAALTTKLHRLRKSEGGRRLFYALLRAQKMQLARGLRAWVVEIAEKRMAHEGRWKEEAHDAEIACLKADIASAEGRYRDARKEADALRHSRGNVAEAVARACRHRGVVAAAIEDRRAGSALKWCFWGWARVAREGDEATATRVRSRAAERQLQNIQTRLSDALGRADQAETELEENRSTIEGLREDVNRRVCELGNVRIALRAIQELAVIVRSRCSRLGATRLHKVLKDMQRDRLSRWFCSWIEIARCSVQCRADATTPTVVSAEHTCTEGYVDTEALTPTTRVSSLEEVKKADIQDWKVHGPQAQLGRKEVRDGKQTTAESIKNAGESIVPSELSHPTPNVADEAASHPRETEAAIRQDISEGWSIKRITAIEPQPGRTTPASPVPKENPWKRTLRGSGAGEARRVFVRATETTRGDSNVVTTGQFPDTGTKIWPVDASRQEIAPDEVRQLVVLSRVPSDLPRLILALKIAIGQELYAAGERLLRCVEADHGEMHGRPYLPATLTGAERAQFRACLEGTANGPIRDGIIALLRAQESSRADAVELDRQQERKDWNGGGGGGGVTRTTAERRKRKNMSVVGGVSPSDLASLRTGPTSSPAEKARAARLLRDRLIVILEVAADLWSTHRRPWHEGCVWYGIGLTGRQRAVANRKRQRLPAANRPLRPAALAFMEGSYTGVYCLDSGAGPRRFWEAMCGPRFVDATWNIDGQVLEEQLWQLALLVRNQDRGQGIALKRRSRLRRLLDQRVYEILMLHVRNGLIWEGMDGFADANIAQGVEHEVAAGRSPITIADGRFNPLGPLLVAADRAIQSSTESQSAEKVVVPVDLQSGSTHSPGTSPVLVRR